MGKKSAPPAPDYQAAAEQTAAGNLEMAKYQVDANRPDTVTPWGTLTWQNDGNNNWTQNISLSPDQQAALDSQMQVQMNQSALGNQLQGQVAQTMAGGFQAPQLSQYMGGTPQLNTGYGGFGGTGNGVNLNYGQFINPTTGSANQNYGSFDPNVGSVNGNFESFYPTTNNPQAGYSGFGGSGNSVNLDTPQFDQSTAKAGADAAFAANTEMLRPQMEQDKTNLDASLRLQGLTPGTEAYNSAMQNLTKTQASQMNQLANQSVLTGNQMANQNYASQLSGYNANLGAQGQDYTQSLSNYGTGQQALAQNNDVMSQLFGQGLAGAQFNSAQQQNSNAAQQQMYNQMLQGAGMNLDLQNAGNAAQQQNFAQLAAAYGLNQDSLNNRNAAQGQQYAQALGQYQTGQDALSNYNQTAQQQYMNNRQNYQDAYTAAMQQYMMPLNAMNAVLSGQQVQMPSFGNQPNSSMAQVQGADYLDAANMLGKYNSAAQATKQSGKNSMMDSLGGIAGAGIAASDIRLKKNVDFLGTTEGGLRLYEYSYRWEDDRTRHVGVMAQEVAEIDPSAVAVTPSGYLAVDYSRIH